MQLFWVIFLPIICLGPFITKAFHIDDTLNLWAAQQILKDPADFYGFLTNWYGFIQPMSEIIKNPPLVPYFIAAIALFFGWSETILHIVFLIPAVCLSIGSFYIAGRFCDRPCLAALITVLSPAFLVSASGLMLDITMLAFYVWAIEFWLRGLERNNLACLLFSGILIALSALSKYFGMTLIPLLLIFSLTSKYKLGSRIFIFIIPILILACFQWMTHNLYGNALISDAASYAVKVRMNKGIQFLPTVLTGLSFTGGCMIATIFYFPLLWKPQSFIVAGILFFLSTILLVVLKPVPTFYLYIEDGIRWSFILQFAIFITTGVHIFILSITDLWKSRDAYSLMLFLWIVGTFAFSCFFNWTINVRTILPMIPAVGILVIRRFDRLQIIKKYGIKMVLPLVPAACIALLVVKADYSLADNHRAATYMLQNKFKNYPHTIWFRGHWGFQYYMELFNAKPIDFNNISVKQGDIIIIPENNSDDYKISRKICHYVETRSFKPFPWFATMDSYVGAGFYTDVWGPLPFAVGRIKPEKFQIFLVSSLDDFSITKTIINQIKQL